MADEVTDSSGVCPGLEQWSAYADGSADEPARGVLQQHLSRCDRCFATVAALRQALSEAAVAAATAASTPPELLRRATAPRPQSRPRMYRYAAAAVVAVVLLGAWYAQRQRGRVDEGEPVAAAPVAEERVFGFAPDTQSVQQRSHALVVFAGFEGESSQPPGWSSQLFDHKYTGGIPMAGTVLPKRYLAAKVDSPPRFVRAVLEQADVDVDLRRYDNDGPDRKADSGDDDGAVDYVFLVLSARAAALFADDDAAAGIGTDEAFLSADRTRDGDPIRLLPGGEWGCAVREGTLESTARAMADGFQASVEAQD